MIPYTNALVHGNELVLFYNYINDVYKYIYKNYNINQDHVVIEKASMELYNLKNNKSYTEGYYLLVNVDIGNIRYCKKYIKSKNIFNTTYDVEVIYKWILVRILQNNISIKNE